MARGMIFGNYDTGANLWTLTEWTLSPAQYVENLVDVPGRVLGPLDLAETLTDGEPVFTSRPLYAVFESSEGRRLERKARIDSMVNQLQGRRVQITLPDDPDRYLVGRLTVTELYNDPAHCSVQVDAICEPWKYAKAETVHTLTAAAADKTVQLTNDGRMTVCPKITITGDEAQITLAFGDYSAALAAGTHQLPDLQVPTGGLELTYSGSGMIEINYREAVL